MHRSFIYKFMLAIDLYYNWWLLKEPFLGIWQLFAGSDKYRATTIGSTLCKCPMYLEHFSVSSLFCQNRAIPFTSLSLVWGFTVFRMKCFSLCQTSLIGFRSGDSAGIIHELILFSAMKDLARLLVYLGSFSC